MLLRLLLRRTLQRLDSLLINAFGAIFYDAIEMER